MTPDGGQIKTSLFAETQQHAGEEEKLTLKHPTDRPGHFTSHARLKAILTLHTSDMTMIRITETD